MPKRRHTPIPTFEAPPPPPPQPSWLERLGGWRGVGASGIRGLSGLLSFEGGLPGAAISGLGEAGAEALEGSDISPARIATEAGIGAVPFGKVFKAGKVGESILRGGLYSGIGAGARELAQGQELDPGAIATSAGIGAATGGGLAKLLSPAKVIAKPQILRGHEAVQDVLSRTEPVVSERLPREGYTYQTPATASPRVAKVVQKEAAQQAALDKIQEASDRATRIIEEREAAGLEPRQPSYRTSESARVPGQPTESVSIGYGEPEKSPGEVIKKTPAPIARTTLQETLRPTGPEISTPVELTAAPKVVRAEEPSGLAIEPKIEETAPINPASIVAQEKITPTGEPSAIAQLFKTRVGATGKNYRLAKEAEKAGEIPSAATAREAHIREQQALKPPTEAVPASEVTPDWVKQQSSLVDQLAKLKRGEKGAVSPELLARLGLGAAGAAVGAATDPLDNPYASAAAGGVAGFAAPSLLKLPALARQAAVDPNLEPEHQAIAGMLSDKNGIKEYAKQVWEMIPQIFRANFLLNQNLVNNAVSGPVGSGYVGALETHLSGDARGTELLKSMNPINWGKEFVKTWAEAAKLTGQSERAGGELVGEAIKHGPFRPVRAVLAAPGTIMTMGDVTTRRLAERAGFTADEARKFTLTSEPEFTLMRRIADFPRGNPAGQVLLPFSRTLANIVEQGGLRTPGLGFLLQSMRKTPDPMRMQAMQQLVGAGAGVGGAVAGYNAPEDATQQRLLRGLVSNIGGPAALLSTLGYTAGQAMKENLPANEVAGRALIGGVRQLPLPTTETPEDWIRFLTAAPGERTIPRSAYPGIIRDVQERLAENAAAQDIPALEPFPVPRPRRRRH